jgi:hypothetical protein
MSLRHVSHSELEALVAALARMATDFLPPGPTGRSASVRLCVTRQGGLKLRLFAPEYEYHVEVDQVRGAGSPHELRGSSSIVSRTTRELLAE